jgi:hypothetical protein
LPEVGLRFNVVLVFAVFKIFLHNGENPLNCSAASGALVGSKLISQAIQEICTHTNIIAFHIRAIWAYHNQGISLRLGRCYAPPVMSNSILIVDDNEDIRRLLRS